MAIQLPKFLSRAGLVQILLHAGSVLLGLIVSICLGTAFESFHHVCPLWGQLVWNHRTIWPWMEETCNFTLYWAIAGAVVYPCLMVALLCCTVCPRTTRYDDSVGLVQSRVASSYLASITPVFAFINIIVVVLHLSSAILITSGLSFFCQSILKNYEDMGTPLPSCAAAQWMIDWSQIRIIGGDSWGVWGQDFYTRYVIACLCQWLLTALWFAILMIACCQCCPACKFELPEEKQKKDKTFLVASRRSQMATPIGTPGNMTPRGSQPMLFGGPPEQKRGPPQMMQQQSVEIPPKF